MRTSRMFGIGLGLAWLLRSFGAVAQDDAAAKALFDRGIAARERGDFATGCPDLAESHRLAPRPGTLFQLAKCEQAAGKIASADVHFHQFVTGVRALPTADQAKYDDRVLDAEQARQSFVGDIPTLTLVLPPSAPTNLQVVRDGTTLTSVLLGVAIPIDPGEHLVTTQVPGGPVHEQRFTVERKEAKRLELEFVTPPPAIETPRPVTQMHVEGETNGARTAGGVVFGLGVAGLVTWGVAGLVAINDQAVVEDVCPRGNCTEFADKTKARDAWARGNTAADVATAGVIAGGVGVVVGAVMLLASSRTEKRAPRQTAWLVQAGPRGVLFGVQGVLP